MDLPIVCSLTETELRQRRHEVLDEIRNQVSEFISVPNGVVYRFEPEGDVLARITRLVDLERQCCQFLTFRIVVEPRSPIALEITGPPESIPLIAELFGMPG